MSYQIATEPARGGRRKGLLVFGLIIFLGGLGAGAALFVTSSSQYEDAVKNLQRAPVGCDTEFSFTGTGTFIFYTETKGTVGEIRGDCENTDTDYDHGDGRIRVNLTFADADGNEINLDRESGVSYDAGGFVGSSIRSVVIDESGDFTLAVESDDSDFVIAVGRDPKKDSESLQLIAIVVAGAGLLIGGLLILLGLRRKPAPPAQSGLGGAQFAPSPFGAQTAGYPQPFGQGGPPSGPPGQVPLSPVNPYPQPPSPPSGGNWGAPPQ